MKRKTTWKSNHSQDVEYIYSASVKWSSKRLTNQISKNKATGHKSNSIQCTTQRSYISLFFVLWKFCAVTQFPLKLFWALYTNYNILVVSCGSDQRIHHCYIYAILCRKKDEKKIKFEEKIIFHARNDK